MIIERIVAAGDPDRQLCQFLHGDIGEACDVVADDFFPIGDGPFGCLILRDYGCARMRLQMLNAAALDLVAGLGDCASFNALSSWVVICHTRGC